MQATRYSIDEDAFHDIRKQTVSIHIPEVKDDAGVSIPIEVKAYLQEIYDNFVEQYECILVHYYGAKAVILLAFQAVAEIDLDSVVKLFTREETGKIFDHTYKFKLTAGRLSEDPTIAADIYPAWISRFMVKGIQSSDVKAKLEWFPNPKLVITSTPKDPKGTAPEFPDSLTIQEVIDGLDSDKLQEVHQYLKQKAAATGIVFDAAVPKLDLSTSLNTTLAQNQETFLEKLADKGFLQAQTIRLPPFSWRKP